MASEFDHVFICVSVSGEEASTLAAFGLTEGTPNVHPGQGTACRRFFFANAYLELLWVSNAADAQSETIQPTHLYERWARRASGACPFGADAVLSSGGFAKCETISASASGRSARGDARGSNQPARGRALF